MTHRLIFLLLFACCDIAFGQVGPNLYFGADLSYVNEMEDCGGVYRVQGQPTDPFALFADSGTNLVRARLWHSPSWTTYSTLGDVRKTIQRTKAAGMITLLDFHYSDDWADPGKQVVPAAWEGLSFEVLKDSVYRYTFDVLLTLEADGLVPEMVQIGNEINPGFLLPHGSKSDWTKLGVLLNEGIRAVRDVETASGQTIKIMLHVAQPENVHGWIASAINAGNVTDFDIIGLSYYKNWSDVPLNQLADYVSRLVTSFGREVIVVETAYPWTLAGKDGANNILSGAALEAGYPASPDGQRRYVADLNQAILNGGGNGMVYWEPAWISTGCSTRWGQGSHWENATFFDFNDANELLPAISFMTDAYAPPRTAPVTVRVNMAGHDTASGVFLAGDMTYDASGDWQMKSMAYDGDDWWSTSVDLHPHTAYRFSFYNGRSFAQDGESAPVNCAGDGGQNRLISVTDEGGVYEFVFGTCTQEERVNVTIQVDMTAVTAPSGAYVAGDLTRNTAGQWTFKKLDSLGGSLYDSTFDLVRGGRYPFAFYTGTTWNENEKESLPHQCATAWGTHRTLDVPQEDFAARFRYRDCSVAITTGVAPEAPSDGMGKLLPHYPNPVTGTMTFSYDLAEQTFITLSVYDLLGREVAVVEEGLRYATRHEVDYDATFLPRGVYVYRLAAGAFLQSRSMVVL